MKNAAVTIKSAAASLSASFNRLPARWRFALFLLATLLVTVLLTIISYTLYVVSGTAQLDLSRPGYKQALSEVAPANTNAYSFSATGPIDKSALDEFKDKYDALVDKTKDYSAFDPGALSDEQLNLAAPADGSTPAPNPQ